MNITTLFIHNLRTFVVLLVVTLLGATSSHGVNLAAVEGEWIPPDSATPSKMWGFIPDTTGACPLAPVVWDVGPLQVEAPGGTLTIDLLNCLTETVSIVIPGQNAVLNPVVMTDPQGRERVTAFTHEAAPGGNASYTWNNLKTGTFLYQSGTHPAKQVHMGLYGALVVGSYVDVQGEVVVLFSEIDPALHGTESSATPLTYKPKYFLVNGAAYSSGQSIPVVTQGVAAQQELVLRFLNAGLMTHVPVLQGPHMKIVAEDGNPYPYPREQYSVMLAAGKTRDATWFPTETGTFALYDRSLSLTSNGASGGGMLVYLVVDIRPPFPWNMFLPAIINGGTGAGQ